MKPVPWFDYAGTPIQKLGEHGAYTWRTRHVSLDADGSPRAYHPDGTGLDDNRNAGYPDGGWTSILARDPAHPDRPYVQTTGSTAGFFVSKTSLHDPTRAETDPAAYVDSETIPYIVFPGAFYAVKGTGRYGDLAMVRALGTTLETAAIVADGGPRDAPLGEMSLALASALGGLRPNPRNGHGAPAGLFEYVVFPGSAAHPAWPRPFASINADAHALLFALGGWPEL